MNADTLQHSPRLERLLGFLAKDPANTNLLGDAATVAFEERAFTLADELLDRHAAKSALPFPLLNLKGMVALALARYAEADGIFESLRAQGEDNPAIRFNLAWAKAMQGAFGEALELLDDDTLAASPRAPSLKIHALHHLEQYDDALACGEVLAQRYPENEDLMGALATLALDAEKSDLALHYGERAGRNAEGRAALGFLALGAQDPDRSLVLFDEALATQASNPRAWVGKGLGLLASGDMVAGADAIDRGAEIFGIHIGSWIASGWAHFVNGQYLKARASFERALAIDPNFSESHGGLAVMDLVDGKLADAQRQCEIALRLDKNCFGGALAKTLLLERSGHARAAQKVREIALSTPIGPSGQTLAQAMVAFGSRLPKSPTKTEGPR